MPHVYYGDPNQDFSNKLIETLAGNGADIIELGIPFSDPVADGATFQSACERSLENGTTPLDTLNAIKQLRKNGMKHPVVLTTYYNIPYVLGIENFLEQCRDGGVQGLIIPNLPIEESGEIIEEGKKHGIDVVLQVAPTTTDKRLKMIAEEARGFIYLINVEGVTGTRTKVSQKTINLIEKVRDYTDLPLLAGFGISEPEHAEAVVAAGADGAIAGSVYANIYEDQLENPVDSLPRIAQKVQELKQGCIDGYCLR